VAAPAVEGAAGAAPEPAAGAGGHVHGPRLALVELRAAARPPGCPPATPCSRSCW
jgi:hypothetical protein